MKITLTIKLSLWSSCYRLTSREVVPPGTTMENEEHREALKRAKMGNWILANKLINRERKE